MEAIAKHDFNATADDELSFRKHFNLKICLLNFGPPPPLIIFYTYFKAKLLFYFFILGSG